MAEVKQWITIKGRHIPIMEGETKADAIKRLKEGVKKGKETRPVSKEGFKKEVEKHNEYVNKEKDPEKRKESAKKLVKMQDNQIKSVKFKKEKPEPKKEEKEIDKNSVEYRTQRVKDALKYAREKIDKQSYSWKETVMDAQYEYDIPRYDVPHLERAMKLYAMKKGKFQDHYEEWDKEFRKQGVNVDTLLNKDKKLEKVHEAEDLLKDYKGYELPKDLRSKKNYLNLKRDEYEANKSAWLNMSKELDKARDKYITEDDIENFGGKELARMLVDDSEHPELMALKEKRSKLFSDVQEYEKIRDEYWDATEKLDAKQSAKERYDYGYPDFKEAVGDYIGFKTNDTGTSYYNDLIKEGKVKIVEMTPEQYIKECAYHVFEDSTLEKTLRGRVGDDDTEKYAKMMRDGTKFDTPYLNYKDYAQEGLHRAVAAYMNGIKKIPVVIVGNRR